MTKDLIVGHFFNMYIEVFSEIRFRKHPSQSSLYFNGAEYFYRQSWSSNYLFLRVCVCVICFVLPMGQYWPFSVNENYYYYYQNRAKSYQFWMWSWYTCTAILTKSNNFLRGSEFISMPYFGAFIWNTFLGMLGNPKMTRFLGHQRAQTKQMLAKIK